MRQHWLALIRALARLMAGKPKPAQILRGGQEAGHRVCSKATRASIGRIHGLLEVEWNVKTRVLGQVRRSWELLPPTESDNVC